MYTKSARIFQRKIPEIIFRCVYSLCSVRALHMALRNKYVVYDDCIKCIGPYGYYKLVE